MIVIDDAAELDNVMLLTDGKKYRTGRVREGQFEDGRYGYKGRWEATEEWLGGRKTDVLGRTAEHMGTSGKMDLGWVIGK